MNEFLLYIKVLGHEGEQLGHEAGLMDKRFQQETKGVIKTFLVKASRAEKKGELENSRKSGRHWLRRQGDL